MFVCPLDQAQTQQGRHCPCGCSSLQEQAGESQRAVLSPRNPACSACWLWEAVPAPHLPEGRRDEHIVALGSGCVEEKETSEEGRAWPCKFGVRTFRYCLGGLHLSAAHCAVPEHNTSFFLAKLNYSLREWEFCTISPPFLLKCYF